MKKETKQRRRIFFVNLKSAIFVVEDAYLLFFFKKRSERAIL